ncbi:MAG: HD-GYP domain-containing protein, partial [Nitrolancea sp.]
VLTNLRHIRKKADHAPERVRDGLTPPPVPFIADPEGERRSLPLDFGIEFVAPAYEETTPVAEAATSVSSRPKPTPRISIVIAIIVFCGASLLVVIDRARFPQAHSFRIGLALFICLVVLAHRYAADIDGRGTTSVAVVPMIGAALLFNAYGVAAVTVAFAVVAKLKAHSPIHRMLFNFGCMLLADGAAVLIFREMVHGPLAQARYVQMLVPGFLAGLTFYLVNHLLICLIRSMAERRRALDIWSEDYRWLWPHYVMAGLLGMTLSVTYEVMGAAVTIVMASPVALMHLAITQFIRRTTGYVNELRRLNRQLSDSYESTLQALSRALDTRDAETEEHSQRVRRYTELIGRRFGLPEGEIAHLSRGALLHDIGKIGVPDAILLKPAQLTADEVEAMRKHPVIGHAMIAHIPFLTRAADIVLHHHESFDGSGYPGRLAGEEIPLGARIFAVVDTFDAMTSDRPYRRALSFEDAFAEIQRERGRQFDPRIVDTLLSLSVEELIECRDGISLGLSREPRRESTWSPSVATA